MADPAKEASNIGFFALGLAVMYWIAKKFDKGFLGSIFFRGRK